MGPGLDSLAKSGIRPSRLLSRGIGSRAFQRSSTLPLGSLWLESRLRGSCRRALEMGIVCHIVSSRVREARIVAIVHRGRFFVMAKPQPALLDAAIAVTQLGVVAVFRRLIIILQIEQAPLRCRFGFKKHPCYRLLLFLVRQCH